MKKLIAVLAVLPLVSTAAVQLTVYNQNFAVVREIRTLDLKKGDNEMRVSDITAHLEPDSVMLRDLKVPDAISILEQNYESDPLSEGLLLRKCEGKTLSFEIQGPGGTNKVVTGKVLRSGYVPHTSAYDRYGRDYMMAQQAYAAPQGGGQPIVELDGKIVFGLPGKPLFESLDPGAFLKPTLLWSLWSESGGKHEVEFSYLTGGMRWEATYNAVAPEKGDAFDIVGWITLENMSGKDFEDASIKLMAGDVARAQPSERNEFMAMGGMRMSGAEQRPQVTERAFEEYHLYNLPRPTTLLDREIKQVEFLRAANVPATRIYVYDGFKMDNRWQSYSMYNIRTEAAYGTICNPKVWTMLEFVNSEKNGLGMPLPKGTVKAYRRDVDGRNEFIGEDSIDHTPRDETIRLYMGNAFDLVGERRQTNFKLDTSHDMADESFEIKLRNHKKEPVDVRIVEHLYRWFQWEITQTSQDFTKTDAQTVEYRVTIPADGQAIVNYTVHYTW